MAIDWTKITKKYRGKWVALKDDEVTVVAAADTVKEAMEAAKKNGVLDPLLFRVPNHIVPYIGSFL